MDINGWWVILIARLNYWRVWWYNTGGFACWVQPQLWPRFLVVASDGVAWLSAEGCERLDDDDDDVWLGARILKDLFQNICSSQTHTELCFRR